MLAIQRLAALAADARHCPVSVLPPAKRTAR